jgi:glucose-6-phosphate isomerase
MYPAALMGLNVSEFREGARWALNHSSLATEMSCQILESWERQEWITQMWTYSEELAVFGEWWQQLWGESLGKRLNRTGQPAPRASTPMACRGPRDQHSLVQQLMDGARDKFVIVNRVKNLENSVETSGAGTFNAKLFPEMPFAGRTISLGQILGAEAQAFERSVQDSGIRSFTMTLDSFNEQSLGALFMLWQICVAQLGEYMGIDAFNQPGVELGKKYAAQLLQNSK